MYYGKIENGKLKIAPNSLIGKSKAEMEALGFYPVEEQAIPTMDDGYYAMPRWVQTETEIVQEWDILPDTSSLNADEVLRLVLRAQVNSLDIPDATASRMVEYFPELTGDGSLIKAGTKINWHGTLKRAAVDLWDTEANSPDNAPTLWVDIAYRDGIRIAPETFTATNAAAMNELMWFGEHIYRSGMAGNVYTPEQAPNAWELVR